MQNHPTKHLDGGVSVGFQHPFNPGLPKCLVSRCLNPQTSSEKAFRGSKRLITRHLRVLWKSRKRSLCALSTKTRYFLKPKSVQMLLGSILNPQLFMIMLRGCLEKGNYFTSSDPHHDISQQPPPPILLQWNQAFLLGHFFANGTLPRIPTK